MYLPFRAQKSAPSTHNPMILYFPAFVKEEINRFHILDFYQFLKKLYIFSIIDASTFIHFDSYQTINNNYFQLTPKTYAFYLSIFSSTSAHPNSTCNRLKSQNHMKTRNLSGKGPTIFLCGSRNNVSIFYTIVSSK